MSEVSEFILPIDEYEREYDFAQIAMEDLAQYLSIMRGISYQDAMEYVKSQLRPTGKFPIQSPTVLYLERNKYGDRELKEGDLLSYMKVIRDEKLILAPNMTAYLPKTEKVSIFASYIQLNLGLRKADKKKAHENKQRGNAGAASYWNTMQQSRKIKNNSLSGMHASPSTIGYNKSAHSSLTSLCRCATSYANSANEKFLGGMRHYYAPGVVTNHMLTAIRTTDEQKMTRFIDSNKLHYPTPDDVIACIKHSTTHYWCNEEYIKMFHEFASKMTPAQRASFVYTGDLYHFDKHNGDYVRSFITRLSVMDTTTQIDNPDQVINSLDDNYKVIATLLSAPLTKGILLHDAKTQKPEAYTTVAATAVNMRVVMSQHRDFVDQILTQRYLPHSVAAFPSSKRMSIPTSDTDSTIFTTQYWVDKYGDLPFTHTSMSISYAIVFLISGMISHTLLMYSTNLGISRDQVMNIEMKNEYIFPVYVLTAIAKHYYALKSACEGNVYTDDKIELERKGVQLRSSNAPREINDKVGELMLKILKAIYKGELLSSREILDYVANIELDIQKDLLTGGHKFLNVVDIKGIESYTQGEEAVNYKSYIFWNTHFSKYGLAPEPPYRAVKVNVNLPNKTAVKRWVDSIEDPYIKRSIGQWVQEENKTSIELLRIPISNVSEMGYPKEILNIIDVRGIIQKVMKPFYLILESLGLYITNDMGTRMLYDEHSVVDIACADPSTGIRKINDDLYCIQTKDGDLFYRTHDELVEEGLV